MVFSGTTAADCNGTQQRVPDTLNEGYQDLDEAASAADASAC